MKYLTKTYRTFPAGKYTLLLPFYCLIFSGYMIYKYFFFNFIYDDVTSKPIAMLDAPTITA